MKKYLLLSLAIIMAVALTACSDNNKESVEKKDSKQATEQKTDVKREMVRFYMDLGNKINAKDADLNTYEATMAKASEDPSIKIEPELKIKAGEAASAVAAELKNIHVSADLKDQKAELEAAVSDFTASYQAKADELKKENPSLEAADASFAQGEEKLGKAFESAKLLAPSLGKQVN